MSFRKAILRVASQHPELRRALIAEMRRTASKAEEWMQVFAEKGRPIPTDLTGVAAALDKLDGFSLKPMKKSIPLSLEEYGDGLSDLARKLFKKWRKVAGDPVGLPPRQGNEWEIARIPFSSDAVVEKYGGRTKDEAQERAKMLAKQWSKMFKRAPSSPKSMEPYSDDPKIVVEKNNVFLKAKLYLGVGGFELVTPKRKTALPLPLAGRGKNAKPEPAEAITNKPFLKRLYMALYEAKLYQVAKAALAGEKAVVKLDEKGNVRTMIRQETDPAIEKVLRQITDKKFKEVVSSFEDYYTRVVEGYEDALRENKALSPYDYYRRVRKMRQPPADQVSLLSSLVKSDRGGPEHEWKTLYSLESGWKSKVKDRAEKDAEAIREAFIGKNSLKLGRITKTKGNLDQAKVIGYGGGGTFSGDILVTFKDGSSFVVRNKTVHKMSPQGTFFAQFPTTFHDVIMPDGSKMSQPSEKRMQDVFARV